VTDKITPQELHAALNQSLEEMGEEVQNILGITPKSWDELSEEEQAIISQGTFTTNCIIGEFTDN